MFLVVYMLIRIHIVDSTRVLAFFLIISIFNRRYALNGRRRPHRQRDVRGYFVSREDLPAQFLEMLTGAELCTCINGVGVRACI